MAILARVYEIQKDILYTEEHISVLKREGQLLRMELNCIQSHCPHIETNPPQRWNVENKPIDRDLLVSHYHRHCVACGLDVDSSCPCEDSI